MNEVNYEAAASIQTNHICSGFSDTIHNQYYDLPQYSIFVVGSHYHYRNRNQRYYESILYNTSLDMKI